MISLEKALPALMAANQKLAELAGRREDTRTTYHGLLAAKMAGRSATDREARIGAILTGDELPPVNLLSKQIEDARENFHDLEDACHIQSGKVRQLRVEAARRVCETVKPKHDKLMKQLGSALTDAHQALAELQRLRNALVNNEVGFYGMFDVEWPDSLDGALDRTSSLADFFRAAKAAGYVKAVPTELR